jgi:hypothetical protein
VRLTPAGKTSVIVIGSASFPPLFVESTLGVNVKVGCAPFVYVPVDGVAELPPAVSVFVTLSSGIWPFAVVATKLFTSWISLFDPVDAVHPNSSCFGTPFDPSQVGWSAPIVLVAFGSVSVMKIWFVVDAVV